MMRPQRIDAGADHELILAVLGARVALHELCDLIAWIAAADLGEPTNPPDLVDALLGIAALGARVRPLGEGDPVDAHDPVDADHAHSSDPLSALPIRDAPAPSQPDGRGDLLR